ncbi:MAG: class I SAM-dependent methyltransferase [Desulfobacteraceae bacterium]|nr:class I SAM-dependent methyltransferase [Desulfobacteraceae bacterium]
MDFNQQVINQTKGFLDAGEGRALYDFSLTAAKMGPCLEIGSYCGKSTVYIGTACKKQDTTLFSIDHHRGSEEQQPGELYFDPALIDPRTFHGDTLFEFRNTLRAAALEQHVVPLVCDSSVAAKSWRTPLSLVFIDGGHALETVKADYNHWAKHVVTSGYLIFHDVFEDPKDGGQAPYTIYSAAISSGGFAEAARVGSLGVLQRVSLESGSALGTGHV